MTLGLAKETAGRGTRVAERVPLGRAGVPEDIAPAVAWLFSAEASYVTGTTLRITGCEASYD
ncbi:SDR family oxidoreductase [Mumia zhuanghuii]|uniref:SDR family oxidoreductase n=1 Tax=Mumia zhuanghuii TaxID=2585211 RepID=UPI001E4CB4F7|nr:SDR family oxidoreductase [Mumia zhuanghuii]